MTRPEYQLICEKNGCLGRMKFWRYHRLGQPLFKCDTCGRTGG